MTQNSEQSLKMKYPSIGRTANFLSVFAAVNAGSLVATPAQTFHVTTFQPSPGNILPKLWKSAFLRSGGLLAFSLLALALVRSALLPRLMATRGRACLSLRLRTVFP